MSDVERLFEQDIFSYDENLFLSALNESLQKWRENELYARRLENSDAPRKIESWEDVYRLPAIDMREFKTHPREVALGEPDEDKALFSSGTTSDTRSFAARSEKGLERHRKNLERFARAAMGEADYSAGLGPQEEMLEALPHRMSRRALFRYIRWLIDQYDSSYYIELDEDGNIDMDFEGLTQRLREGSGRGICFGAAGPVEKYCSYLEETDQTIDLGEDGLVVTGGGWKSTEANSKEEYRNRLTELFGIKPENHLDLYSASEFTFFTGNRAGDQNPDQKRIPSHGFAYVIDEEKFRKEGVLEPVDNAETGLLVVVDPLNQDYPGVILTDDRMKKTGGVYGKDVRLEYVGRSTL